METKEMQVFQNEEFGEVRTLTRDGEPWFVAKDVCEAFGDTNYRRSVGRLDDDEKGVSQMYTPGGTQDMTIVNEPGLYSLLFYMQPQRANLPDEVITERLEKLQLPGGWRSLPHQPENAEQIAAPWTDHQAV